ncbi:uncharacterized protein CC84DRAFT_1175670 [Paraphaeosphaeria sporulosa]|uniref:Uncharacterized protein n=1 Tax=Paraphaeosphaeria sporulosa TaxID=1460663 RepID=A0A177CFL6_9PLEO|nr:uncharacterized protein CC84DRAFT_1175670 [Paraphaeosphaeria sporulosa]OAG05510.1 hypothetical protein CC84DRAFT_1175670 [Paraphaeosphaeria sporulosa]
MAAAKGDARGPTWWMALWFQLKGSVPVMVRATPTMEACSTALQRELSWAFPAYGAQSEEYRDTGSMSYRRKFTFWGCARACCHSTDRECKEEIDPATRFVLSVAATP